ncbi:putative membrane protein [Bacillus mesophilus]|uniref:ECF transporter S component n=1 Tax=Bacillus mesophilus TaxID=1808955 RepID=A0A6M0Q4N5_9BACI|nr:ECF transporter S component [Bacillus mesophilus]MBM7661192.1 putative membrane protein [Bacillus mesophilus]NEY71281.1 ECF transporter S component [Bacillus mesophilus]
MSSLKKQTFIILFFGLSAIGAAIKIPLGISSIALDSAPALLATILLGPIYGAIIGAGGHFISAYLGGLPLGAFHLLIALEMGVIIYLTGVLCKKGTPIIGLCFFIICSTVVAPLPFYFILTSAFYWTILFPLFVGSTLNSIIVAAIYKPLQGYLNRTGFYA